MEEEGGEGRVYDMDGEITGREERPGPCEGGREWVVVVAGQSRGGYEAVCCAEVRRGVLVDRTGNWGYNSHGIE
jgi:hypothetical protein